MRVDPNWHVPTEGGACLVCEGGNPEKLCDRVAFIEKTPRIRTHPMWGNKAQEDNGNWAFRPWKGNGPSDPDARQWCEDALRLFGYELS